MAPRSRQGDAVHDQGHTDAIQLGVTRAGHLELLEGLRAELVGRRRPKQAHGLLKMSKSDALRRVGLKGAVAVIVPVPEVEVVEGLHHGAQEGFTTAAAERRAAQELHAARIRGEPGLVLITGRGWGNKAQKPVLRQHMETWLLGPEGRRHGVRRLRITAKGGALEVELGG